MGKLKWYKRDPDAALSGMHGLTLEERGAYNTVLDLIYARGGDLDDDERFIAGWLQSDVRVWRRIREKLITTGKIKIVDGKIWNGRAEREIAIAMERSEHARQAALSRHIGQTSAELTTVSVHDRRITKSVKPLALEYKNNDLLDAVASGGQNTSRIENKKEDISSFETFWELYPRKVSKKTAFKAFEAASQRTKVADIIAGVRAYASQRAGEDEKFTKHPATWLNGDCWRDALPAAPAAVAGAAPRAGGRPAPVALYEALDAAQEQLARLFAKTGMWPPGEGPRPDEPGCRVPSDILLRYGLTPYTKAKEAAVGG